MATTTLTEPTTTTPPATPAPAAAATSEQAATPAAPPAPTGFTENAPDPAVELMQTRSRRAADIRERLDYDGELNLKLLSALQPLLEEATPMRYVTTTPATTGKPYISTGLNSTQYQVDYLNAVFGLAHWRYIVHYEDGGTLARCFVIVGNRLTAVKLDEHGELDVPEEAEILVTRDGWGGHARGSHKGDILKGSETNAMKRTLARMGPGGDVYRLDVEADLHGQGQAYQQPQTANPAGQVPAASVGEKKATQAQVNMLRAKARDKGLTPSQLANLLRHVAGVPPTAWPSEGQAQAMLDDKLPKLPRNLVNPMVQAIESGITTSLQATVAAPAAPVTDAPPVSDEIAAAPAMTPPGMGNVIAFDPAALAARAAGPAGA